MRKQSRQTSLVFIFIVIFVFAVLIYTKFPNHPFYNQNPTPLSVTYAGTLPCADCPGINESITLIQTGNNPPSGSFSIRDIYQERNNNQPFTTTGTWVQTTGTPQDPNAIVYELMPSENQSQVSYYLKINDNQIIMLDGNKQKIDSPFDTTLTKQ